MITNYFKTPIHVLRKSQAETDGVVKNVYTNVLSTKGINIDLNGSEIEENQKQGFVTTHRAYMPVVDVRRGDKLKINEMEYEVKDVKNPMNMNRFLMVDTEMKS